VQHAHKISKNNEKQGQSNKPTKKIKKVGNNINSKKSNKSKQRE